MLPPVPLAAVSEHFVIARRGQRDPVFKHKAFHNMWQAVHYMSMSKDYAEGQQYNIVHLTLWTEEDMSDEHMYLSHCNENYSHHRTSIIFVCTVADQPTGSDNKVKYNKWELFNSLSLMVFNESVLSFN